MNSPTSGGKKKKEKNLHCSSLGNTYFNLHLHFSDNGNSGKVKKPCYMSCHVIASFRFLCPLLFMDFISFCSCRKRSHDRYELTLYHASCLLDKYIHTYTQTGAYAHANFSPTTLICRWSQILSTQHARCLLLLLLLIHIE